MDQDSLRPLLKLLAAVVGVQVLLGVVLYFAFGSNEARGTFGDMFGAVNTLFSGLAFAGVIYAILLQRKELSLQRKELELTRGELERSAEAQERSAAVLDEQLAIMQGDSRLQRQKEIAAAQPVLRFGMRSGKPHEGQMYGEVENAGAPARNLRAEGEEANLHFRSGDLLLSGGKSGFDLFYPAKSGKSFSFVVHYNDSYGSSQSQTFSFDSKGRFRLVSQSFEPDDTAA